MKGRHDSGAGRVETGSSTTRPPELSINKPSLMRPDEQSHDPLHREDRQRGTLIRWSSRVRTMAEAGKEVKVQKKAIRSLRPITMSNVLGYSVSLLAPHEWRRKNPMLELPRS